MDIIGDGPTCGRHVIEDYLLNIACKGHRCDQSIPKTNQIRTPLTACSPATSPVF
jgi:hypothetical protein